MIITVINGVSDMPLWWFFRVRTPEQIPLEHLKNANLPQKIPYSPLPIQILLME